MNRSQHIKKIVQFVRVNGKTFRKQSLHKFISRWPSIAFLTPFTNYSFDIISCHFNHSFFVSLNTF